MVELLRTGMGREGGRDSFQKASVRLDGGRSAMQPDGMPQLTCPRPDSAMGLAQHLLLTPSAIYSTPAITPSKAVDSLQKITLCSQSVEHSHKSRRPPPGRCKVADRRTGSASVVTKT